MRRKGWREFPNGTHLTAHAAYWGTEGRERQGSCLQWDTSQRYIWKIYGSIRSNTVKSGRGKSKTGTEKNIKAKKGERER